MRLFSRVLILCVCCAAISQAAIMWSSPSLSDDNGGAFLTGSSSSSSGGTFILNLPQYFTSNFDSDTANTVTLNLTVSLTDGFIVGLKGTYFGMFTGSGQASFNQTANNGTATNGTFSSSMVMTTINNFTPTQSLNLTTILHLNDMGDSAAVNQVRFDVTAVPEPATVLFVGLGLAILGVGARIRSLRR